MRVVHALRKLAPASALIRHQRLGIASFSPRSARTPGTAAAASLTPLRGAPVKLPADAAPDMGRNKAADKHGKANTLCYVQVHTE